MGTTPVSPLVVRADASTRIGAGHVMRCLSLAQGWQAEGDRAIFLSHCESKNLSRHIEAAGIGFIRLETPHPNSADIERTLTLLREFETRWLVLDGYHFDPVYQEAVRKAGYRLLVIDDTAHWPDYHADILLNQNIHAGSLSYICDPDTTLLLGTRYVLLRPEFLIRPNSPREIREAGRKVLVTLGGGDPNNLTLKVIQALQKIDIPNLEVNVIVGPSNPHKKSLEDAILSAPCYMRILENATNMPELMGWADLAVSGGGSTSWELAFMGLPSVVLVMAENQRLIAEELDKMGVVSNLGWHERVLPSQVEQAVTRLLLSAEVRKRMASRGQGLVDGDGVARVLMRVRGQRIRLRRAREEDRRLIWEWSNDPSVRAVSFSSEPILWEQHLKWFESKLNDPGCFFYIALDEEDTPVGQVRYDTKDGEVVVSISLGPNFRGKRYGNEVIELSSQKLFKASDAKSIHSYVKMGNEASIKVFLEAGFKKLGMEMMHGEQAVHLILPKKGAV
jgi:UDP-2,4-diacetamido-2,4,6-trideoxy-beta-L-altropyranose hydrolase